jgi:hypothetical protein
MLVEVVGTGTAGSVLVSVSSAELALFGLCCHGVAGRTFWDKMEELS